MSDFISNRNKVHSGELNKTYEQHHTALITLNTQLRTLRDFPEITIQADRKVRIGFYIPGICLGYHWNGVYIGFNVKVNGTQYHLGSSGKAVTMADGTAYSSVYNNTKIVDFIGSRIVQPGQEYTLQFSIKGKMSTGTARIINGSSINRTGIGKGTPLPSVRNQNHMCLIIEELVL